ncbi:hypothetical protein ACWJJH_14230 [Endozoicomonadaceae bacterium StTr2]
MSSESTDVDFQRKEDISDIKYLLNALDVDINGMPLAFFMYIMSQANNNSITVSTLRTVRYIQDKANEYKPLESDDIADILIHTKYVRDVVQYTLENMDLTVDTFHPMSFNSLIQNAIHVVLDEDPYLN